jgi:hypothetical protein
MIFKLMDSVAVHAVFMFESFGWVDCKWFGVPNHAYVFLERNILGIPV